MIMHRPAEHQGGGGSPAQGGIDQFNWLTQTMLGF